MPRRDEKESTFDHILQVFHILHLSFTIILKPVIQTWAMELDPLVSPLRDR